MGPGFALAAYPLTSITTLGWVLALLWRPPHSLRHLGPGLALAASPLIPRMYGTGSANTGSGVHDAMLFPVLRCQLVEIVRRRCRVPGIYCPFVGICRYFVPGIV